MSEPCRVCGVPMRTEDGLDATDICHLCHIEELEKQLAALTATCDQLRGERDAAIKQRDEVCRDPRLQLRWGVFVGDKIVMGCMTNKRAEQMSALGKQQTPPHLGEFSVRSLTADWQDTQAAARREESQ